ncbi:GntR family transcriptional regulator [Desulforhopalus singaporensis]|uniref:DNA-binding transcriptional regulator, GntR family n=1 Tax=Desulforhopalus singaporensis TaxID=91360 RepID=A0A1H0UIP7_9BACT|nr:GntR family transcriptional regulator [Desulforhopalus singaporensis]SDP65905.1 DNA-binding transcriptional regulator, GntR family [Desulforhopalus singaporensis]
MSGNNVYQELKKQIILLDYKPGEVIREKEVMAKFDVSRTPVREALMRLEMDGLVRIIPNVGSFAEDVSFQQLKDVLETYAYLVKLSGILAAERISKEDIAKIRERVNGMKQTKETKVLMGLDGEIHQIINDATKNKVLIKILSGLYDQSMRIWVFAGAGGNYWRDLENQFENIANALERRDGEMTARLLEEHTNGFVEHIRSQLAF